MIRADHDDTCPGCGDAIREGDAIDELAGDWYCAECVEAHREDEPRWPCDYPDG